MALPYYFRIPFGYSGDRTAIPVAGSNNGPVNFTYGYGEPYSLPRSTDPAALTIPRVSFNQLMYAATASIQQLQQYGVPYFITSADNGGSPFSYSKNAIVRWDNGTTEENYLSLINTNTALPSDTTKWLLLRNDPAYLGQANTFTAVNTFSVNGTPVIINSVNSTANKIQFTDNGASVGYIGASSAYFFRVSDAAGNLVGGWNSSGHLVPAAASTYDLGTSSAQWRAAFVDRLAVLGSTAPANGLYLPAANTVGVAANGGLVASFTTTGLNNTVIGATTPAAGTFTTAVANSFVPNSATVPSNGMYLLAANTLGWSANSAARIYLSSTVFGPTANDGSALGGTTSQWADLFLATGGVINWANGDVTITHSTDALAFAGAATQYSFAGGPIVPSANDGLALGTTALSFADLFLASGGVINWNNGNATLTHSAGALAANVPLTANSFSPSSTTIPNNGLYLFGGNIPAIAANASGTAVMTFNGASTAVNYLRALNAATGQQPGFAVDGSDTNIGFRFFSKGTGGIDFFTGGTGGVRQALISHVATAVNYIEMAGAATGNNPAIGSNGSDTNVGLTLFTKGTGIVSAPQINVTSANIPANGVYLPAANVVGIAANSLDVLRLNSAASGVNYWKMNNNATGTGPALSADGPDTNIACNYSTKGQANHIFYAGAFTRTMFTISGNTSSVNYIEAAATVTGKGPVLWSRGSDASVDFLIIPKGDGTFAVLGDDGNTSSFQVFQPIGGAIANRISVYSTITAGSPSIIFNGSDTNVNGTYQTQAAGSHLFRTGGGLQAAITDAASAVNYFQLTGAATGVSPAISAQGATANLNFQTVSKGTGVLVNLGSWTNSTTGTANVIIDSNGLIRRTSSQLKYKYDIEDVDVDHAIAITNSLRPIFYRSKLAADIAAHPNWTHYSWGAEDVAALDPRLAHWGPDFTGKYDEQGQPIMGEEEVPVGVQGERVLMMMCIAFRAQIAELQAEVAALKQPS